MVQKSSLGISANNSKAAFFFLSFFQKEGNYGCFFHFIYASECLCFFFHWKCACSETLKNIFIRKSVHQSNACKRMLVLRFLFFLKKTMVWGRSRKNLHGYIFDIFQGWRPWVLAYIPWLFSNQDCWEFFLDQNLCCMYIKGSPVLQSASWKQHCSEVCVAPVCKQEYLTVNAAAAGLQQLALGSVS